MRLGLALGARPRLNGASQPVFELEQRVLV